jgi:hypothetical protein
MDLLLLKALLLIGQLRGNQAPPTVASVRDARTSFAVGLGALLEADKALFDGRHEAAILKTFAARGIVPESNGRVSTRSDELSAARLNLSRSSLLESSKAMKGLLKHVSLEEIPETEELFSSEDLEKYLGTFLADRRR